MGDFGLTMSMRQESAISPVGTVEYMAPEVRCVRCARCAPAVLAALLLHLLHLLWVLHQ